MNFAAHIGTMFLAPFMMASSLFGGGHAAATMAHASASSSIHASADKPDANQKSDRDQDKRSFGPAFVADFENWFHRGHGHATTTPATTTPATVSISSIDPSSGPVGTSVTLTGSGFTSDSVVHFGAGAIKDATTSSDGTVISFTVPSSIGPYCPPGRFCPMYLMLVTPRAYDVYVSNDTGTSGTTTFTVTKDATTTPPVTAAPVSVNGVSGPVSLVVGADGTWTVNASLASTTGNLSYSVNWGDEGVFHALALMATAPQTQSSATFTHAYQTAGTYHPTFTVTDDSGHRATASETVVVTGS